MKEPKERKIYSEGELMGAYVLSGRVFEIFPSYPLSLRGYCLRSLECAEGACIVRRPSYMHHPPIAILLRESTPSTLYLHSLFCINPFVLALIFLQFLLRVYACTISRTPSYIRVGSTVDGEKKEELEIRREHEKKRREEGDRERDKESTKSRG